MGGDSNTPVYCFPVIFAKNAISNVLDCDTESSDMLKEQDPLTTRKPMV